MKKIFRTLAAVFAAGLVFAFFGCETDTEKVYVPVEKDSDEDDSTDADTTAPADVTNLSALTSGSDIVLTWTDPADADLYAVKIYTPTVARSVSLSDGILVGKGVQSYRFSNLTSGTKYTFKVSAVDTSMNESAMKSGASVTATPLATGDTTAPASVSSLAASCEDGVMTLSWTNPIDDDFWGAEITAQPADGIFQNAIYVKGASTFSCSNLESGTSYVFTVKALDTSMNESAAAATQAVTFTQSSGSLSDAEPLSISLSASVPQENGYTGSKSNTTVTVTATITTASTVKKVVYKKDGSESAAKLLADDDVTALTADESDNKKWTFTLSATDESLNGATYTVAAIDEAGREETEQITLGDVFDFTAPAKVTKVSATYDSDAKTITLTWTAPTDDDFDHVLISYITNDGESDSGESEAVSVAKEKQTYTLSDVDSTVQYYKFTIKSVDELGNTSNGLSKRCNILATVPEGFVAVAGGTITGKSNTNNYEGVFIEGRTVTLSDFYIAQYETTQDEYKEVMKGQTVTVDGTEYTLESDPSYCKEGSTEYALANPGEQGKRPVEGVTWYDAVYYCNAKSEKEGLTKAYNITVTTVDSDNHITVATVSLVDGADGYRLPTEAEWEYAARGGDTTADAWDYTFSGADTASGTSYGSDSNSGLDSVGWYCYNNITGTTGTSYVTNGASGKGTHQVGQKNANTLGLYDMSGNVWEWCYDWYNDSITTGESSDPTGAASGSFRVLRGGSWYSCAYNAAVCGRLSGIPNNRVSNLGFRVVRSSSN